MKISNLKSFLAVASFLAAIVFGAWGMILPPPGIVSGSVLILIAQFLVLSAGFLGMNIHVDLMEKKFHASSLLDKSKNEAREDLDKIEQILQEQDKQVEK